MSFEPRSERRDRRTLEYGVLAGIVLPLATVAAVRWIALTLELSVGFVVITLFGAPLVGALLLVGSGPWEAGPLGRKPDPGPAQFRDQIPERYHEEFSPETLHTEVEEDAEPGRVHRYALLYCFGSDPHHAGHRDLSHATDAWRSIVVRDAR